MPWQHDPADSQPFPEWTGFHPFSDWSTAEANPPYTPLEFNGQSAKPSLSKAEIILLSSEDFIETQEKTSKRTFECPLWRLQTNRNLPRSCNGAEEDTISDLLRHLRRSHCYVERCVVCKKFIFDQTAFLAHHGRNNCTTFRKQSRGDALDDEYKVLFAEVEKMGPPLFISLQLPPGSSAPADNNGRSSVAAMSGLTCYSSPLSFSPDPAFDSRNDWGFPTEPWPTSSATMSSESSITYLPAVFNNTSLGQPDPTTTPSPNVSLAQPVQEDSQS